VAMRILVQQVSVPMSIDLVAAKEAALALGPSIRWADYIRFGIIVLFSCSNCRLSLLLLC
jgi:hypothetical protein